eukprot:COSAG02_NODE_1772_length_10984_cov_8.166651_2_plen_66_part_00
MITGLRACNRRPGRVICGANDGLRATITASNPERLREDRRSGSPVLLSTAERTDDREGGVLPGDA